MYICSFEYMLVWIRSWAHMHLMCTRLDFFGIAVSGVVLGTKEAAGTSSIHSSVLPFNEEIYSSFWMLVYSFSMVLHKDPFTQEGEWALEVGSWTPYITFHRDKEVLIPHLTFIPKGVSEFHLNQSTSLPVFFLKPHLAQEVKKLHTLHMPRMLLYYIAKNRHPICL